MKKLSIAAGILAASALPVLAETAAVVDSDPFAATAGLALAPLAAIAGIAIVVVAVASSSGT